MSNILNIVSNSVAKVFHKVTEFTDSIVLLCKDEHTVRTPSVMELKRKQPGLTGTVLRLNANRRVTKVLDAGTESERVATAVLKHEYSIPVGFPLATIELMEQDMQGLTDSDTMSDMKEFGIIDPQ